MSSPHRRAITLVECCSAFASTQPPALPQTHRWHRWADRLLSASRPPLVPLLIGLGAIASLAGGVLPVGPAMLALGAFFLVSGGWCDLNLARSREAHCLVTGIGWSTLATLAFVAAWRGADWHNALWLAFFGVLAAGVAFEMTWAARSRSTAL
jgi:hypothetical protein